MSTTVPPVNGKQPRKQLSDQLDRLDTIIDALADELPAAVATATRDGVQEALKAVVADLLADPDVLARIRATLATTPVPPATEPSAVSTAVAYVPVPAEPKPGVFARLKSAVRNGCRAAGDGVAAAVGAVKAVVAGTRDRVVAATTQAAIAARSLSAAVPLRRFLAVALGVSVAVAVASYALPHTAAAVVGGIGGACTAVAVQATAWLRRSARSFGLAHA